MKAGIIVLIILIALVPVYWLNRYFQKVLRPRESMGRLLLYVLSGMALVFVYTFLLVWVLKRLFPGA